MAKTKREFIFATCLLSGAAAIMSFVSLGTQEWVTSRATNSQADGDSTVKFGLFGGIFNQRAVVDANIELYMVCLYDKNICALMCGDSMTTNLEKLYNNEDIPINVRQSCNPSNADQARSHIYKEFVLLNRIDATKERIFINTGIWMCTILFLCISAVMGLFSAGLAVWNTASNPYQVYLSIFGLYIYNAIAFFCILLAIILWGAMFAKDTIHQIPTYKVFFEGFVTDGYAQLGYSYWINIASLIFYMISICLLYTRNYLISREPEVNVHIEENADPVIYLY